MSVLTPRQQQALSLDRHLCVTANAGSGKTRVLVERYLGLVLEGHASAREIVALTFTEKAASELRNRIAGTIQDTLQKSLPPLRRKVLEAVRTDLAAAWIGTIHSFCSRLLREYPVEAGVDAAFGVIEGLDQRMLLRESIRTAVARSLQKEGDESLALIEAVRLLGRSALLGMVTAVAEHRETWERWHEPGGLYTLDEGEIGARWDRAIDDYVAGTVFSNELQTDLRRLKEAAEGKDADSLSALCEAFSAAGELSDRAGVFSEILMLALTAKGEFSRKVAGSGLPELRDVGLRLSRWRKELLPLLDHVRTRSGAARHGTLLATSRAILRVAEQAVRLYTEKKQDAGQLDFDDLQLFTRRLLGREEIARALAGRFRYFLVDEFQDTNRLQYEILLPLVDDLRRGNLFIVGDPKQSIYRFRNANVAVFDEARSAIVAASGPEADLVLEESFRPRRELLAYVNRVFQKTMGVERHDQSVLTAMEVAYDPLVQARGEEEPGRVELLLLDSEEKNEAVLLARRMLRLKRLAYPVTGKDQGLHPVRFGDMAILLRSRTVLPEVEQALARHGIPFVVNAGTGYFQTQDVLDFYNFLRVLVQPSDDVALAGVLRSPFFAVSDAELFEACLERRSESLWDHLHARGLPESTSRALRTLDEVRSRAEALTVPETVALIISMTMYESKLGGMPGGQQALANLDKLRALARRTHLPGFLTLHDFAARMGELIDQEEHEGQGAIDLRGDAVQVMTIHAAKGLEFPVVAVPFLHRQFRFDSSPFIDEHLGLGFSFEPEGEDRALAPVTLLNRELNRRRTVAEEKRIAYVAFTRARDALLLSGSPDTASRGGENVLTWVLRALDLQADAPAGVVERSVDLQCTRLDGPEYVRETIRHTIQLRLERPGDVQPAAAAEPEAPPATVPPHLLIEPVPPSVVQEFLSATRLRVYRECPRLYYLRYVLGYPGLAPVQIPPDQDELSESRIVPGAFGRAFHAVMESIDRFHGDPELIRLEAARTVALEQEIATEEAAAQAEELTRAVLSVIKSSTWQRVMEAKDARTEFTISAPLGADYMVGTMDRIFRDERGVWNLLDYKTDRVTQADLALRAEEYRPQIEFYALLVAKYFAVSSVHAALLFSAIPENPVRFGFSAADLEGIERGMLRDMDRIRKREFPPTDPNCRQCPFGGTPCRDLRL